VQKKNRVRFKKVNKIAAFGTIKKKANTPGADASYKSAIQL